MRVGTSAFLRRRKSPQGDHPHACGDKTVTEGYQVPMPGSSPCVWGQGIINPLYNKNVGIIPMRVGTSFTSSVSASLNRDHPHACGDKKFDGSFLLNFMGSSPCVWGQASHN